jgi:hypothetical protein
MELYVDGVLDTFKAFTGTIQPSTKPLTIGRMDNVETLYALKGSVDEVKLWDKEIPIKQVENLKNQWATPAGIAENEIFASIYPNPADDIIYIEFAGKSRALKVSLLAADGREILNYQVNNSDSNLEIKIPAELSGMYLLKIQLKDRNMVTRKIIIR